MLRRLIESHRGSSEFHHCVVSLTTPGVLGAALGAGGVDVQALGMRGILSGPITMLRLTRLIRRIQPDVVQTWMYHADFIGGLAARAAGNRHIIWGIRGTDMLEGTSYTTFVVRRICAPLSRLIPAVIVFVADASALSHSANRNYHAKIVLYSTSL